MTWKGISPWASSGRTNLVHEWVTGGGLAGRAACLVGGRGSGDAASDRGRLCVHARGPVRVIVTSDARLAD